MCFISLHMLMNMQQATSANRWLDTSVELCDMFMLAGWHQCLIVVFLFLAVNICHCLCMTWWVHVCTVYKYRTETLHVRSNVSCLYVAPFFSDRQHLSYDGCLEVGGEIIRTVLCCIMYWNCAQSQAHLDKQFLQFSGLGFVSLGPFHCA